MRIVIGRAGKKNIDVARDANLTASKEPYIACEKMITVTLHNQKGSPFLFHILYSEMLKSM
jgi:hypothetical protein